MSKKIKDINIFQLHEISFKKFKEFLDSLDEEKKTWSLDLNVIHSKTKKPVTNIKEYYETASRKDNLGVFAAKIGSKVVGLVQANWMHETDANRLMQDVNLLGNKILKFSFVVHKKYQGKGIGTLLLKKVIELSQTLVDAYCAVYYTNNIASHMAFKKNGFLVYGYSGKMKDQFFTLKKIKSSTGPEITVQPKIINNNLVIDEIVLNNEDFNTPNIKYFKYLDYELFEKFINSLTDEKNTWSLDANLIGTDGIPVGNVNTPTELKRWYDVFVKSWPQAIFYIENEEVLGLAYVILAAPIDVELANFLTGRSPSSHDKPLFLTGTNELKENIIKIAGQVSVVVNKNAQGKGIGTQLLRAIEIPAVKHNIDFFYGRRFINNIAATKYQSKVGWNDWGGVYNYESDKMTDQVYCGKLLSLENINKSKPDWGNIYESPMTFCISTYNNFNYLQLAIKSVRKNSFYKFAPFVVYAENCTDGTNEWLEENKEKYNLEVYIEPDNKVRRGIGGGMNFCASKVKTEFINFLQADIYVAYDWDIELLKLHKRYVDKDRGIVFSQRIQPDIFNDSERAGTVFVPMDEFGEYYHNFDEKYFLEFCQEFRRLNGFTVRKGEGVSGLIRKEDWDYIGGNDDRFAPAYYEDMDLFIRMQNEGFKFMLTSNSLIYHFASRSSRFPDDDLTQRPKELSDVEQNSMKEFIGKYGRLPENDKNDFVKAMPITDGTNNRI